MCATSTTVHFRAFLPPHKETPNLLANMALIPHPFPIPQPQPSPALSNHESTLILDSPILGSHMNGVICYILFWDPASFIQCCACELLHVASALLTAVPYAIV